jgi:alkylated DNA nucleotide flippase Atl1
LCHEKAYKGIARRSGFQRQARQADGYLTLSPTRATLDWRFIFIV